MEVMIPIHQQDMDDFDFNSARSSPYLTPPSTPRGFGNYYTSAPTTPSRPSPLYQEFDYFNISDANSNGDESYYHDDFAFDAIQEEMNNNGVVTAADLFEGGMGKPVNEPPVHPPPPPRRDNPISNSTSEVQWMHDKVVTRRTSRGRGRSSNVCSSSKRETRSLSPPRVSEHAWAEIGNEKELPHRDHEQQSSSVAKPSSKSCRKWRFRDLFLFRSASEGRASEKDNLKKYSLFSISRRRAPISAQELMQHKENRGATEETMKKKKLYKPRSFWNKGFHGYSYNK